MVSEDRNDRVYILGYLLYYCVF